ncbi:hypothetical protein nbrc107696_02200 [Gordonia spumicola]|uniref:Lipoprotein LprC n=1 Tax=Gordonia spumicola TaxID=589161 RepID=A0A7I9V3N1_9ACTN|nr:DUF3558 domain-containing protein [Gordonia spumicola]GED99773.1 hypothetical protein nbrc107696_02200 [Gordonia spumicola]
MTSTIRKAITLAAFALAVVLGVASCTVDGTPVRQGRDVGTDTGHVDTDKFEKLLAECEILPATQIAKAVGGSIASPGFFGANCRWVVTTPAVVDVTFNWFEWGDFNHEKDTAKRLGFTTDNIQVQSSAAFTARDPKRPAVCGVTAKAPMGGIYTWWVEPSTASAGDACAAPIKLMELILTGSY